MVIHAVCPGWHCTPRVPDAKTIWLFREHLARASVVERLFAWRRSNRLQWARRPDLDNAFRPRETTMMIGREFLASHRHVW
jgi:hypothetical protein